MQGKQKRNRGFNLIELLVVLAIIGLLVGTVAIGMMRYVGMGQERRIRADLRTILQAANAYKVQYFKHPDSIDQLTQGGQHGEEAFLQSTPQDPWGNPYIYRKEGSKVIVECMGEDGAPGGEGSNRDFSTEDQTENPSQ